MENNIKRNLPLLYIIQSVHWFLLIMPTIVLFFQDNGLSLVEVMIVQAAFSITVFLFEIPSGYFSDKIGRRVTLITGLIFSAAGLFLFGLVLNFAGFIFAEILLGIGSSFISGTDSSMLYDTLLIMGRDDEHHKKEGLLISIGNYSESIASLLGGVVAVYSMKMNFFIEGWVTLAGVLVALFLIEPQIDRAGRSSLNFNTFINETGNALRKGNTLYLTLFGASSGLGTFLALWYIQPEMALRGLPIALFGVVWAGLNSLAGLCANLSHKIPIKGSPFKVLRVVPFLLAISYFTLVVFNGLWILIGFSFFYIIRGLKGPFERNMLHLESDSHNRATILSVQSLLFRIMFSILGPIFALLSRSDSNSYVFIAIGVLYLVLGFANLLVSRGYTGRGRVSSSD